MPGLLEGLKSRPPCVSFSGSRALLHVPRWLSLLGRWGSCSFKLAFSSSIDEAGVETSLSPEDNDPDLWNTDLYGGCAHGLGRVGDADELDIGLVNGSSMHVFCLHAFLSSSAKAGLLHIMDVPGRAPPLS